MAYDPTKLVTTGAHGRMVKSVAAQPGMARFWSYTSDDTMATLNTIGYFADAYSRGMRQGDLVYVVVTAAGAISATYWAPVITCTRAAGADLANGDAHTMTNSD